MISNEENTNFPKENESIFDQTTVTGCMIDSTNVTSGCPPPTASDNRHHQHQSLPPPPPSSQCRHVNNVKTISIQYFVKLIYYCLFSHNFMKANYKKQYTNVPRCKKKMCANSSATDSNNSFKIALAIVIMLAGIIDMTEGGTCWLQRMESGKCNKLYTKNITRDECCQAGYDMGYTDRDVSQVEAFFADAFNDGVMCSSCLQNCESATCGAGKRCILKKGRPKCICAPVCKAIPKHANTVKAKKPMTNINVINLSQSHKNFKRHNLNDMTYISSNVNSSHHDHAHHSSSPQPHHRSLPSHRSLLKLQKSIRTHQRNSTDSKGSSDSDVERERIRVRNRQLFEVDAHSGGGSGIANRTTSNGIRHHRRKEGGRVTTKSILPDRTSSDYVGIVPHKPTTVLEAAAKRNQTMDSSAIENLFRSGFFEKNSSSDETQKVVRVKSNHGNYFNPVCGTDGKTYKTECQLKKRACRQESTALTVAYRGHCQTSCRFVQCALGKQCIEDQYSTPHCVECLQLCPAGPKAASKLICGVDGVTYKNLCELKQQACLTGRSVQVAYKGACNDEAHCDNIVCKDRQTCLPDLLTSRPRCVSCSFKCPRWKRPPGTRNKDKICGTNNHSYHSWCQLVKDSCNTGFFIDIKHDGACKLEESTEIPMTTTDITDN